MHPKFVDRLANIYVSKMIKEGIKDAQEWAERLLNRETVVPVSLKVREILKKKGYKVQEPQ